ncbi:unnamed protein product, partial [Ranitomeya imitator]
MALQSAALSVCDEPISPGGHTVDLSPVTAHSPGNPQSQSIADEIIAAVESDACRRNQLSANPSRKRSASETFSNSPELELSSPRLSRSVDPQMPAVACQFFSQPPDRCYGSEGETERIAAYGAVGAAVAEEMHLERSDHLATGGALLGNAVCKIENENFSCSGLPPPPLPPQAPPLPDTTLGPDSSTAMNDIVLPLENMFEEPINLSLKKCYPTGSSSAPQRDPTPPQPVMKEIKNEADSRFQQRYPQELKRQEGTSSRRLSCKNPAAGEYPARTLQPETILREPCSRRLSCENPATNEYPARTLRPTSSLREPCSQRVPCENPAAGDYPARTLQPATILREPCNRRVPYENREAGEYPARALQPETILREPCSRRLSCENPAAGDYPARTLQPATILREPCNRRVPYKNRAAGEYPARALQPETILREPCSQRLSCENPAAGEYPATDEYPGRTLQPASTLRETCSWRLSCENPAAGDYPARTLRPATILREPCDRQIHCSLMSDICPTAPCSITAQLVEGEFYGEKSVPYGGGRAGCIGDHCGATAAFPRSGLQDNAQIRQHWSQRGTEVIVSGSEQQARVLPNLSAQILTAQVATFPEAPITRPSEQITGAEAKETKIPYVRLERLKICPPPSGELPVFKVQPPKKDEDGSLRLLIKYGARYKSMSIK